MNVIDTNTPISSTIKPKPANISPPINSFGLSLIPIILASTDNSIFPIGSLIPDAFNLFCYGQWPKLHTFLSCQALIFRKAGWIFGMARKDSSNYDWLRWHNIYNTYQLSSWRLSALSEEWALTSTENCGNYWKSLLDKAYRMKCPDGLQFSMSTGFCTFVSDVKLLFNKSRHTSICVYSQKTNWAQMAFDLTEQQFHSVAAVQLAG